MTSVWSDPDIRRRLAPVRLCVLDVDGTTLSSRHEVTVRTRAAVHAAQSAGLEVLLASSRGPAALKPVLDDLHAPAGTPFVASQGAVLGSFGEDGQLHITAHRPAPLDQALAVARRAAVLGLSVSWYSRASWLVEAVDPAIEREAAITHSTPTIADLGRQAEGPDKLMVIAAHDRIGLLHQLRENLGSGLRGQRSNPTYLEVTAADVDKASTVLEHSRTRGYRPAQVLVMGDGPNDLGMFSVAGISVAPANASPEVLAAADAVSPSNDDDGVAFVLTRLIQVRAGTARSDRTTPAAREELRRLSQ
jgi:Cof subfamily protein (haloacid dehalogenase superfamily)